MDLRLPRRVAGERVRADVAGAAAGDEARDAIEAAAAVGLERLVGHGERRDAAPRRLGAHAPQPVVLRRDALELRDERVARRQFDIGLPGRLARRVPVAAGARRRQVLGHGRRVDAEQVQPFEEDDAELPRRAELREPARVPGAVDVLAHHPLETAGDVAARAGAAAQELLEASRRAEVERRLSVEERLERQTFLRVAPDPGRVARLLVEEDLLARRDAGMRVELVAEPRAARALHGHRDEAAPLAAGQRGEDSGEAQGGAHGAPRRALWLRRAPHCWRQAAPDARSPNLGFLNRP